MLDMMLSTLRNEPTDKMLPKDPIDPIEKAEPREPIDINELVDHKLSTELVEPMLLMELVFLVIPHSFYCRQINESLSCSA